MLSVLPATGSTSARAGRAAAIRVATSRPTRPAHLSSPAIPCPRLETEHPPVRGLSPADTVDPSELGVEPTPAVPIDRSTRPADP
jgi:hypothetical protein